MIPRLAEDDLTLLKRIASADADGLCGLYDRWVSVVYSVAFRIVPDPEEAEEITENTFWQVWQRAGEYEGSHGTVEAWLETIARDRARDRLRQRWRAREAPLPGRPEPLHRGAVRRALDSLPAEQQAVLQLACYGGMNQSEIAECTGRPLGTVRTFIRLAMEKLRAALLEARSGGGG